MCENRALWVLRTCTFFVTWERSIRRTSTGCFGTLWKLYLGKVSGSPYPPGHRFSIRVDAGDVPPHLLPGLLVYGQTPSVNNERDPSIPQVFSFVLLLLVSLLDSLQHSQPDRRARLTQTGPDPRLLVDDPPRRTVVDGPAAGHRHGRPSIRLELAILGPFWKARLRNCCGPLETSGPLLTSGSSRAATAPGGMAGVSGHNLTPSHNSVNIYQPAY